MTLEVHRRAARILKPGITTTAVRRFIDQAHRALGADDGSSFCAVQFGVASTSRFQERSAFGFADPLQSCEKQCFNLRRIADGNAPRVVLRLCTNNAPKSSETPHAGLFFGNYSGGTSVSSEYSQVRA